MKFKFIKSVCFAALAALYISAPAKVSAAPATIDEHTAIIETAYSYFEGIATGNRALMERAFDMEFGHIKYVTKDKETGAETIRSSTLADFADNFTEAVKEAWVAEVLSIDVVDGRMAMVKLDFDTPRTHYIDYLVMYKREEGWRIINKTFVMNQK